MNDFFKLVTLYCGIGLTSQALGLMSYYVSQRLPSIWEIAALGTIGVISFLAHLLLMEKN